MYFFIFLIIFVFGGFVGYLMGYSFRKSQEAKIVLRDKSLIAPSEELHKNDDREIVSENFDIKNKYEKNKEENTGNINWLFYLGAFFIIAASLAFIGFTWNSSSNVIRFLLVLVITLAFAIAGFLTTNKERLKTAGFTFFLISALLLPLLGVSFNVFIGSVFISDYLVLAFTSVICMFYYRYLQIKTNKNIFYIGMVGAFLGLIFNIIMLFSLSAQLSGLLWYVSSVIAMLAYIKLKSSEKIFLPYILATSIIAFVFTNFTWLNGVDDYQFIFSAMILVEVIIWLIHRRESWLIFPIFIYLGLIAEQVLEQVMFSPSDLNSAIVFVFIALITLIGSNLYNYKNRNNKSLTMVRNINICGFIFSLIAWFLAASNMSSVQLLPVIVAIGASSIAIIYILIENFSKLRFVILPFVLYIVYTIVTHFDFSILMQYIFLISTALIYTGWAYKFEHDKENHNAKFRQLFYLITCFTLILLMYSNMIIETPYFIRESIIKILLITNNNQGMKVISEEVTLPVVFQICANLLGVILYFFWVKKNGLKKAFWGIGLLIVYIWWLMLYFVGNIGLLFYTVPLATYLCVWGFKIKNDDLIIVGWLLAGISLFYKIISGNFQQSLGVEFYVMMLIIIGLAGVFWGYKKAMSKYSLIGSAMIVIAVLTQTVKYFIYIPWWLWLGIIGMSILIFATYQSQKNHKN